MDKRPGMDMGMKTDMSTFMSMGMGMDKSRPPRCVNGTSPAGRGLSVPEFGEVAFNVINEARGVWQALNGTLVNQPFNPIISEFMDITLREFRKMDAWSSPFSM